MDITPQDATQQPISDDQELAKALAGVLPDVPDSIDIPTAPEAEQLPTLPEVPKFEQPSVLPQPSFVQPTPASAFTSSSDSTDLESIKKTALNELRPLIDKVDLPAEEKFDTYLMLIRSTDDSTLISPAHAAAQEISDETRRAQALLDIIKEIDYLSRNNQSPTI